MGVSSAKVEIPMPPYDPGLGFTDADEGVVITGRWPLSNTQWEYLMGVLTAMKPGLVRDPDSGY